MKATARRGAGGGAIAAKAAWLFGGALALFGGGCESLDSCRPALQEGAAGATERAGGLESAGAGGSPYECKVAGPDGSSRPTVCPDAECERQCFLQRMFDCPTCPPPPPNGRGLYIITANDSNYCLPDEGEPRYCPDGFVQGKDGEGVLLRLRDLKAPGGGGKTFEVPLGLTAVDTTGDWSEAALLSVRSDKTELAVEYRLADEVKVRVARGLGLRLLRFALPRLDVAKYNFELRIDSVSSEYNRPHDSPDTPEWLRRYAVSYRAVPENDKPTEWRPQCTVGGVNPPSSFVEGRAVDAMTGAVHADDITTMSCRTGAIDTCLAWGYTPWAKAAGQDAPYMFATCLQAKRAAYFISKGDYNSYTVNRTPVHKQDVFQISPTADPLERLEAAWRPSGARCLNLANLRVAGLAGGLSNHDALPPCDEAGWASFGPMATGAATP